MQIMGQNQSRLTAIEGFCGAGGMALGFIDAGIDVRLAFDVNIAAISTYRLNIGDHARVLDATRVSGADLLNVAGIERGDLDLFSGGPPCQGFSKQKRGAHLLDDERNSLVLHFARLVTEMMPRGFIFENVEIFGQKRGVDLVKEISEKLQAYKVYKFFVNSAEFGLAQRRGRFIMIGIRRDVNHSQPILERENEIVTIRDVIGHLPSPPADYTEHPLYPNHIKCKITRENEIRFSYVPQGGGWRDIPYDLRLPCHKVVDTSQGGWPDVYGRLEWDGQCPTITAGFDSFTRGRYGHPRENRSLTLREGAMLQGFPEQYRFIGRRDEVRLQIGNAVPPPLARAVATSFARALRKEGPPEKSIVKLPSMAEEQFGLSF